MSTSPQRACETWPSFAVLPTSMPYNSTDVDPNVAQPLYCAPQGVYNAFVQLDSGPYEVGADVIVSAIGGVIANPPNAASSDHHIFADRANTGADGMR